MKNQFNKRLWDEEAEDDLAEWWCDLAIIIALILLMTISVTFISKLYFESRMQAIVSDTNDDALISPEIESYMHRYHVKLEVWDLD